MNHTLMIFSPVFFSPKLGDFIDFIFHTLLMTINRKRREKRNNDCELLIALEAAIQPC